MLRSMIRGFVRGATAVFAWAVLSLVWVPSARADIASAEALFRQGRELLAEGKVAEACLKFAESQRQDPSPGTLLNLAACHQKQGRTASAWAEFLAAKRSAQTVGRSDLADEAQKQADAIAPQRSFLTISVKKQVPGLRLTRNGEGLDAGSYGAKLPSDPGRYTVVASAPGRKTFSAEVSVEGGGDDKELEVPELELAPATANGAEPEPTTKSTPPARRSKLPYIVGGVGLGVTTVGLVFGGLAASRYSKAKQACPTFNHCGSDALDDRSTAGTFANVANVGVGVGLAGVVAGAILLITQPSSSNETPRTGFTLVPVVGGGATGALVSGGF